MDTSDAGTGRAPHNAVVTVQWVRDSDGNRVGEPASPGVAVRPGGVTLTGIRVRIEPLDTTAHAHDLWKACDASKNPSLWTYMLSGPFNSADEFRAWITSCSASQDTVFYAVVDIETNRAIGVASYLRIDPTNRVIEVGNISFFDELARTPSATEAMTLMAEHAFGLGYRRYEWKCNVLNTPSVRAAERLGFSFEGVFRNAIVVRGFNRDTAWFAMTDGDWPAIHAAHAAWLSSTNFDNDGTQRQSLRDLTRPLLLGQFPSITIDFEERKLNHENR